MSCWAVTQQPDPERGQGPPLTVFLQGRLGCARDESTLLPRSACWHSIPPAWQRSLLAFLSWVFLWPSPLARPEAAAPAQAG